MLGDKPRPRSADFLAPGAIERPVTEAPHERHFKDGEEPPERYDRENELEYVLPLGYQLDSKKYFRIARRHYRHARRELVWLGFRYCLFAFLGVNCVGWIYLIALHPGLRAGLIS